MSSNSYSVRLLSIAEQDLQELVSSVAAENLSAAQALPENIEHRLHTLRAHPFLGRIPNDERPAGLGSRVLVVDNYLAFYKVKGRTVLVHRVIHGAREFPRLLME